MYVCMCVCSTRVLIPVNAINGSSSKSNSSNRSSTSRRKCEVMWSNAIIIKPKLANRATWAANVTALCRLPSVAANDGGRKKHGVANALNRKKHKMPADDGMFVYVPIVVRKWVNGQRGRRTTNAKKKSAKGGDRKQCCLDWKYGNSPLWLLLFYT